MLQHAIAENRAVLTLNRRHFIRFHLESSAHAGIIGCTFDPGFLAVTMQLTLETMWPARIGDASSPEVPAASSPP